MIKIQSYGQTPTWYQTDTSYNLPSQTGAVQWNGTTKCFEVSTGPSGGWQRIDNTVQINNSSAYDINVIGAWVTKKMQEEEETKKLRSKYPALDEAYNHLELIKALVVSGPETEENSVQSSP
jgi:hypothetical protein